ncbi:DEKNAAC101424 [Brettanomyces naardenensis]|uniref:DEKNAAC101424 n=1 Tax=Brettanomyces naardenensis TaxID=13370 RepID=A0A448YI57_BRENA|nr:DEKNAAC101424 [Brettanomyces naardenensis]
MPVNMLNFSNVEMQHDWLVTPATQDSNNFDVYEIKPPENSLHRILKGVDVTKFGNIEEPKLEDSMGSLGLDNRRGFGIVMKVAWIDDSHLVVAYENGYVVTFEHSDSIQAVAFNSALSPEPVTSLLYDGARDILLAASASDKLCIIKASQRGDTTSGTSIHHIRHRGIGDLAVSTDGTIGLITWDGYARFFHYNEDKTDVDFVFKVKRQMPSIADNRPNSTDDIKQQDFLHPQKSSVVAFSRTQVSYRKIKEQNQIEYNNGMSKNLIRRRLERDFDHHWMLIGYKDGRVAVYNVT